MLMNAEQQVASQINVYLLGIRPVNLEVLGRPVSNARLEDEAQARGAFEEHESARGSSFAEADFEYDLSFGSE